MTKANGDTTVYATLVFHYITTIASGSCINSHDVIMHNEYLLSAMIVCTSVSWITLCMWCHPAPSTCMHGKGYGT